MPRGNWTYPDIFGGDPVQFDSPGRTLFGCFGSVQTLPPEVHARWQDSWCKTGDDSWASKELRKDELLALLAKTRQSAGVVEAYTWLDVTGSKTTRVEPANTACAGASPQPAK